MVAKRKPGQQYDGLLAIGDPHIESRQPGFRCDDYANVILDKLRWCFNYAIQNNLLPMLLGDLFDKPRDNPNWLITQLIGMMQSIEVVGIFGNHDCAEVTLTENDSLSILIQSGCLTLVDEKSPWVGEMNGRQVLVGGSSYRARVPDSIELPPRKNLFEESSFAVWMTHHDISMVGYDGVGRFSPFEIENVDLLINGHIHRRLDSVTKGQTTWVTPGNISRRSRSEANRIHVPSVLRIDVQPTEHSMSYIEIPHQPAAEVFHEAVLQPAEETDPARFVDGLKELQTRRTESGAGLHQFLDLNLSQFDDAVASEIWSLAEKVTDRPSEKEVANG